MPYSWSISGKSCFLCRSIVIESASSISAIFDGVYEKVQVSYYGKRWHGTVLPPPNLAIRAISQSGPSLGWSPPIRTSSSLLAYWSACCNHSRESNTTAFLRPGRVHSVDLMQVLHGFDPSVILKDHWWAFLGCKYLKEVFLIIKSNV